ncbi:MAG: allophanate hydrolase [Minwuia sp.]|nr:allophanate hydrolase [Minwuia sp.]
MSALGDQALSIAALRNDVLSGRLTPTDIAMEVLLRCDRVDPNIWITRRGSDDLLAEAARLDTLDPATHPLLGIPFAVKDNIDVAGLPTTAACPTYAHQPEADAFVVARLRAAGALVIGKTNLDQFATGLVGVRSPYGVPANSFNPDYVPGGSSSGSAVAVAKGLVAFSLGTDTAGSGRVPAAFNNLIGWKPTKGILSTSGVVPACRSLDCVSIFTLTADDAAMVSDVATAYDAADAFARPMASPSAGMPMHWKGLRVGVPLPENLEFFGDRDAAALFGKAVSAAGDLGAELLPTDISPFLNAARLLYEGPWVAERYLAIEALIECQPEALHPVTREITLGGATPRATDLFRAEYRLAALRRQADTAMADLDILLLPTTGTIPTVQAVLDEPIKVNSDLGRYTNFMNLLDLSAVAVPGGFRADGMPLGVTLAAPAFHDRQLLALAGQLHVRTGKGLGISGATIPEARLNTATPVAPETLRIAVCGAHMSGLPLNGQLRNLGATFEAEVTTAEGYGFYALAGPEPKRPGLLRRANGDGGAISMEVWQVPVAAVGHLLAAIPAPLGLGTISLSDGSSVKGFLCEAAATSDARDITAFGGWRAYIAST